MNITNNIRSARKAAGLTLDELAAKVGVSTPHLSEMERGIKSVSVERLHKIAEALGCHVFELLSQEDDLRTLLEITLALSLEDRTAVLRHASGLLSSQGGKGP